MPEAHIEGGSLALHYLGHLGAAESDAIHQHLGLCAECRDLAHELAETLAALALIGDDYWTPHSN